jgi:hypothetical protein
VETEASDQIHYDFRNYGHPRAFLVNTLVPRLTTIALGEVWADGVRSFEELLDQLDKDCRKLTYALDDATVRELCAAAIATVCLERVRSLDLPPAEPEYPVALPGGD